MSQWGMSIEQAVSLTERQIDPLMLAYLERKKFEAKITLSMLGEALQSKDQGQEMSFAGLSAMGFEIKGG